eukprot:CAMPEP_0181235050 /NCGR_PEP_ID=MMETSP1096-20121128/37344_1 /TAXON_ID=156174 ORGANISM="Chrysochromulina ericina, Strain CCMP281" /NCGR_SAMPLE_ID=MMETSP1096 /ASSEMBLY_ACC=CAM_ASM_000453 /LENGTH=35 /DNA_ID= /DNA_START= /DNA_END= /DNA_ORIENTATION=
MARAQAADPDPGGRLERPLCPVVAECGGDTESEML